MAERSPAVLSIGGRLEINLVPALIECLVRDHARTYFEEQSIDESHFFDGTIPNAYIAEAVGGCATYTEDFCIRHQIAFERSSGSRSGIYGCESAVFTGEGEPRSYELSESVEVVLDHETFHALGTIDAIEAWFAQARYTPPPLELVATTAAATSSVESGHD